MATETPGIYSITLAAGAGSRMPSDMPPKSCCKVGPIPVIEHVFQAYEEAGVTDHVVVVGCEAQRVMEEVSRLGRRVLFAFQDQPLGTGHAVHCALDLLELVGPPRHVLICAGDKLVSPSVLRGLLRDYTSSDRDMCLAAGRSEDHPTSGRIVTADGLARAVLEAPDIQVRRFVRDLRSLPPERRPHTPGDLRELAATYLPKTEKLAQYVPALAELIQQETDDPVPWEDVLAAVSDVPEAFSATGATIPLETAAEADLYNLSVYVGAFHELYSAVRNLRTENVQGERYFTDVVDALSGSGRRVGVFRIKDPADITSFNTMEELQQVRELHAQRAVDKAQYPDLETWTRYFSERESSELALKAINGLADRVGADRPAIAVLSPGRINLMGRHIDHQGGTCNLMAIDRGIALVASPRQDDRVNLWNVDDGAYPDRSFRFREITEKIVWEDWLQTLDSQFVRRMVGNSSGDWANYIKGAALRLQHRFPDRELKGMDAMVCGNIPAGAGLSSSSALVVAAAEAFCELNGLNLRPREFVDLCGEGEWFVGTRGGSADHAAIKFGRENRVISVSFFPFRTVGEHPFPDDHRLIVAHSGLSAKKTENARQRFNSRVACYHMAREYLKREAPAFAPRIAHLRDINTRTLDISLAGLYELLKRLPPALPPEEAEMLAEAHSTVAQCVESLDLGKHSFPLRDVALFGLAECERSTKLGDLLQEDEVEQVGKLMQISHNGDRVTRWQPERTEVDSRVTDERLDELRRLASSAVSPLSDAGGALWQQPGGYDCSTPEIDLMVDTVLQCAGVRGAQLAGAGLGGCIMILARKDAAEQVEEELERSYYEPREIEPRTFICQPAAGSRVYTTVADMP